VSFSIFTPDFTQPLMKKQNIRRQSKIKPQPIPVTPSPQDIPEWTKPAYIEWHRLNCHILSVHTALLERVREYHSMHQNTNPTSETE